MSGTASRFQTRFGYNPRLTPQNYPVQPLSEGLVTSPAPQAPQQPQQPAQTPVAAGATPPHYEDNQPGSGINGGAGDAGFAGYGTFGGAPSGLGLGLNYGTAGSALGTLAGLATGIPGLGLAGNVIGTLLDAREMDGRYEGLSAPNRTDVGRGVLGNMTFGYFGRTPDQQWNDFFDQVQPTVGAALPDNLTSLDQFGFSPSGTPADMMTQDPNPTETFSFDNVSYSGDYGADAGAKGDDLGAGYGDSSASGGFGGENQFMKGGYTGAGADGIVQPWKPAGIVHEGELVIPAHMVSRLAMLARGGG